jgi:hypothetical protein
VIHWFRKVKPKQQPQGDNHNRRSWNTPVRQPWNPIIKHCLNAIDYHVDLYVTTGDPFHLRQAQRMREYVHNLKEWITKEESKHPMMNDWIEE